MTNGLRVRDSDQTELLGYIGDPDGARTRKLQRERLMTIPVCLQDHRFVGRAVSITRLDSMDCVAFIDLSPFGAVLTPQTFHY